LFRNKLRPPSGEVKRNTPTSGSLVLEEHKIVCKYSRLQQLRSAGLPPDLDRISATYPPFIRRKSTGFSTGSMQGILRFSAHFPLLFAQVFIKNFIGDSRQIFISFSESD
jgi:hypothetical protein